MVSCCAPGRCLSFPWRHNPIPVATGIMVFFSCCTLPDISHSLCRFSNGFFRLCPETDQALSRIHQRANQLGSPFCHFNFIPDRWRRKPLLFSFYPGHNCFECFLSATAVNGGRFRCVYSLWESPGSPILRLSACSFRSANIQRPSAH